MIFEIPILVEQSKSKGQTSFTVRPLFLDRLTVRRDRLAGALSKLDREIRKLVQALRGSEAETETLIRLSFSPDVSVSRQKLEIELKKEVVRLTCCVAEFAYSDRRQLFFPADRQLWLEYKDDESRTDRATELLTEHLRRVEKNEPAETLKARVDHLTVTGSPWLTHLRMEISTRRTITSEEQDDRLSFMGASSEFNGSVELNSLGQCIDSLFPDELGRAIQRTDELKRLSALMQSADKRPVLLLGPPKVGKTALVHEYVYQTLNDGEEQHTNRKNVWLLPPQKIVSGMSYVGQWENRVLAILDFMVKKQHVLYLNDMLAMFQAGVHSKSTLSAADVLKPYVERRDLRLLVEMTPGQLRVFRERDRGFADMFQIIRLEPSSEDDTLRILVDRTRSLEEQYRTTFSLDVIPTVLHLSRRYDRESAFPGKASQQLQELAVKHSGRLVDRNTVLTEFRLKTGFREGFIDANETFARDEMLEHLSVEVLGQPEAVASVCDVISVARARLNDPGRPLGAFLFPGPTGVGKTHCAKSLAAYLYGDVSRLLRFDMNEFQTSFSVARLVGTFDQPEGLLTSAVRQQPFCVILFDEIEKAHPDVYDMLLQVLGEARLTDSLGRTVDFSGAIIILTSNLGARDAAGRVGLGTQSQADAETTYLKAIREFFRPEFVNRFDRVIPFRSLRRAEIAGIAESLLSELLSREGFMRRKCCLELDSAALETVVERGYQPAMGARAMRRSLEREIVRPVSERLAEISPETPSIIRLASDGQHVVPRVFELEETELLAHPAIDVELSDFEGVTERIRRFIARVEAAVDKHRPVGPLATADIPDEQYWYLGVVTLLRHLQQKFSQFCTNLAEPRAEVSGTRSASPPVDPMPMGLVRDPGRFKPRRFLKDLAAAEDISSFLEEMRLTRKESVPEQSTVRQMIMDAARLNHVVPTEAGWQEERVMIVARALTDSGLGRTHFLMNMLRHKYVFAVDGEPESKSEADEIRFGVRHYVQPELINSAQNTSPLNFHEHVPSPRPAYYRMYLRRPPMTDGKASPPWTDLFDSEEVRNATAGMKLCVSVYGGFRAAELIQLENGTHLFFDSGGGLHPVQLIVRPMPVGQTDANAFQELIQAHMAAKSASADDTDRKDPFHWGPVVTVTDDREPPEFGRSTFDMRTGTENSHRALLPLLALPFEFTGGEA